MHSLTGRTTTVAAAGIPDVWRSPVHRVAALRPTLASEAIKLVSARSSLALLGLTVAVGGLSTWAVARYVTDEPLTVAGLFTFSVVFTAVFAAVAGIVAFSAEAQHGTLGPTLAARPSRSVLAGAKTILVAAVGALLGTTGLAAGITGAWLGGIGMGDTSAMVATSVAAVGFTMLAAVLGLGVGMVARHSTVAVSGLLVWWLVVENLLTVFLDPSLARFLPFAAGHGLIGIAPDAPDAIAVALTRSQNAMVFGGYALAALVLGTVLLHRRDATC